MKRIYSGQWGYSDEPCGPISFQGIGDKMNQVVPAYGQKWYAPEGRNTEEVGREDFLLG